MNTIWPILSLLGLAAVPSLAHILSKLWGGRGTFEGTVNSLMLASSPAILIGNRSELWTVILGAIAIRRVQGIPWWAAALISLFGHVLRVYGIMATFVRWMAV